MAAAAKCGLRINCCHAGNAATSTSGVLTSVRAGLKWVLPSRRDRCQCTWAAAALASLASIPGLLGPEGNSQKTGQRFQGPTVPLEGYRQMAEACWAANCCVARQALWRNDMVRALTFCISEIFPSGTYGCDAWHAPASPRLDSPAAAVVAARIAFDPGHTHPRSPPQTKHRWFPVTLRSFW